MKIGITGKRKIKGSRLKLLEKIKYAFLSMKDLYSIIEVYVGMALGFDQLVCEAINELKSEHPDWKLDYIAVIPFEGQEKLWTPLQIANYNNLLLKAKNIILVTQGPYEIWKLHARNNFIVENVEEMIVYWDGIFSGGTGNCMKRINAKKLPFTNLYS